MEPRKKGRGESREKVPHAARAVRTEETARAETGMKWFDPICFDKGAFVRYLNLGYFCTLKELFKFVLNSAESLKRRAMTN